MGSYLGIGTGEILIILAVALIVFGPHRLPELAKYFAQAMKMFRDASNEIQKQLDMHDWDKPKSSSTHKYDSSKTDQSYSYNDSYDYSGKSDNPYAPESAADYGNGYTGKSEEKAGSPEGTSSGESWVGTNSPGIQSESGNTVMESGVSSREEPLNDPVKEEDAQRYSREMSD